MTGKASPASRPDVEDARAISTPSTKQGGWITFPFIIGSLMALTLAIAGASANLIVYLIKQFNVKSVDAAQIFNIVLGCINVAPVLGAIISDSHFGCFTVVAVSTFASMLSMILFTLTVTLPSLRPTPCVPGSNAICQPASTRQLAVLYAAVALMCVAAGGTRFNTATMGADQFDTALEQDTFFNWYFVALYVASVAGFTALVYVEDSVSWGWGFGACAAASAVAVVILLLGVRHYRKPRPAGSPFTGLAQVVVAATRKWKVASPPAENTEYYHGPGVLYGLSPPSESFSCLNRAAVKTEGDTNADGSLAKPWRLCTVQQVEDLKAIHLILPLWSTSIFISVSIGIQASLTVLQGLTVDRSLGSHFSVPVGSLMVSSLLSTVVSLSLLNRCVFPAWRALLSGRNPTPLQRVGLGHVLNAVGMAASALVERRRMEVVRSHRVAGVPGAVVPMSVLWLLPPLVVVGVGEAMHFPGQVALYYQEFPVALRSSATGMIALIVALGFYLSTAVIDLVRKVTDWLPDDVNASKLDRVYWMLAAGGVLNFGVYVVFARMYKYQSSTEKEASKEGLPGSVVKLPQEAN